MLTNLPWAAWGVVTLLVTTTKLIGNVANILASLENLFEQTTFLFVT